MNTQNHKRKNQEEKEELLQIRFVTIWSRWYPEKRDCYRNIESIRINWLQCLNYKATKPHASINLRFALATDRF